MNAFPLVDEATPLVKIENAVEVVLTQQSWIGTGENNAGITRAVLDIFVDGKAVAKLVSKDNAGFTIKMRDLSKR